MSHASTWRLSLRKGKGEQRVMKVVASPSKGWPSSSPSWPNLLMVPLLNALLHIMYQLTMPGAGEAEASYQIFDSGIGDYKD